MYIGHRLDDWRQNIPEDEAKGYCSKCGEALYGMEYGEYCSEDCVMEDNNLKEIDIEDAIFSGSIKEDSVCGCCGEHIANWCYAIQDADGDLYCDVDCFVKQNI
ncbi:TPA: hypothetical protein KOX39_003435 [Clostridioides difficile]|nr:hypothetical protein [Clostridioides difficile]